MPINSALNLSLPVSPLTDDKELASELQIIYNALNVIVQALNDAGIPAGGVSPSPSILGVASGGTGVNSITGILRGNGTSPFSVATGVGDVVGPAAATANGVAIYDGITGKLLKNATPAASGGALNAYVAGANGLSTGADMSALHTLVVNIRAALIANNIMS